MQCCFGLGDDFLVFFGLAEFDQCLLIVKLLLDARNRSTLIIERRALLHQAAGTLRIIP
jgi:hypothetical protein